MPPAGAEGRALLFGTLATLRHRELVRADIGEEIDALLADGNLDDDRRAMVRLAAHDRSRALAVPERLVRAESELASRCTTVWRTARDDDDFASFAAALRPLVGVKREMANILANGGDPYDGLLDEFEPGARTKDLEPLFDDLCRRLAPIVEVASANGEPAPLPDDRWDEGSQMELAHTVARMLGFDLTAGLIGITPHPFTSRHHAGDVRFSTHIDPRNPVTNVAVVLHEAGHALYDQGLPARHGRTRLHADPSMGAQESQSRFYEMHIGCATPFWRCLEPEMRRLFPGPMARCDIARLAASTRVVRRGPLRLAADEVTYNLHIAVRFRLEVQLVRGAIEVDDLPEAWSQQMQDVVGVRPGDHRDGVLQDIHWASGMFGYFPTYTLGNIYAAQLRAALEESLGPLDDLVQERAFDSIRAFMRDRVHSHGRKYPTRELMRAATGRDLGTDELVAHLEGRYLPA